jgi:hypothetical protein
MLDFQAQSVNCGYNQTERCESRRRLLTGPEFIPRGVRRQSECQRVMSAVDLGLLVGASRVR